MKKIFIKIGCVLACTSLLAGCSEKTPEPTEEYKSSFTKEEVVASIKRFIPNFEHEEKGKNLDQKI